MCYDGCNNMGLSSFHFKHGVDLTPIIREALDARLRLL